MKRITRDDTEHGVEYYRANEVDSLLTDQPAQQEPWCMKMNGCKTKCEDCPVEVLPTQQEPVAWVCEGSEPDEKHGIDYWPGDVDDLPIGTQLYTSPPPQRTWVGLTDHQKMEIWADNEPGMIVLATEAKLKELNT